VNEDLTMQNWSVTDLFSRYDEGFLFLQTDFNEAEHLQAEVRQEFRRRDAELSRLRAEVQALLAFRAGVHRVYDAMPADWGDGYEALGKLLASDESEAGE
jgi:hypothetical protein